MPKFNDLKLTEESEMPFFNQTDSIEVLHKRCIDMYCSDNFLDLPVGQAFRTGLHAIVECIIKKTLNSEITKYFPCFKDANFVLKNQLYCGEIAHQYSTMPHVNNDSFSMHLQAALCFSAYLNHVVFENHECAKSKKVFLKNSLERDIRVHVLFMLAIDKPLMEQEVKKLLAQGSISLNSSFYSIYKKICSHQSSGPVARLFPELLAQSNARNNTVPSDASPSDDQGLSSGRATPSSLPNNRYTQDWGIFSFRDNDNQLKKRHDPYALLCYGAHP